MTERPIRAIVVADGAVPERADLDTAWPGWADGATLVVAADGGARGAARLGLPIDRWVGDGDSLGEQELAALAARGVPVERSPVDKDESDAELAVRAALRLGATEVTILGALGGARLDHALANVALLGHPTLGRCPAQLLDVDARVRLVDAPGPDGGPVTLSLVGRAGDGISLLPLGADVHGVTTAGLRYPLAGEPLTLGSSRGLSNVRLSARATVTVDAGRLLVVETPATLR